MFRRLMAPRAALADACGLQPGVQALDFAVRPARTLAELHEAVGLRAAAYGKRGARSAPSGPDPYDFMPNATVLVAIEKHSGRIVGSLRVVMGDVGALELDAYVSLPRRTLGSPAEAARLVVGRTGSRLLVRLALWKAFHRLCLGHGIDTMVLAARRPLDENYAWLGFADPDGQPIWFVPGGAFSDPHRVLSLSMHGLAERWRAQRHDLYHFNVELVHPDIRPFSDDGLNPLARLAGHARLAAAERAAPATHRGLGWPADLAGWVPV